MTSSLLPNCSAMTSIIQDTATLVLQREPGAVVLHRLLRDVLKQPHDSVEVQRAKEALNHSQCIQELADEQRPDGGWGAFHSRSTRVKQRIASTEVGVERALALGLETTHPLLQRASTYLCDIVDGKEPFPDYHEKNDRWPTGMRLFVASTLSLIHPNHPALNEDRRLWRAIAEQTFQSGTYSEEDEVKAHAALTGATVRRSYLVLNGRYQLNILGSLPGTLSGKLEMAILRWLWERPDGIGYLSVPLNRRPPDRPGPFDRWLASLELLARLFPPWVHFGRSSMEWLWKQRDKHGFWDFGPRPSSVSFLPLSDSWRVRQNRVFDWTTRVLILARQYCDACAIQTARGEIGEGES